LTKPDIAAADGGNTSVENYAPFFGTSAAAPHAGAIAALLLSKFPNASPAQIRAALVNSALDIQPAGVDRDSGAGIIMPLPALKKLGPPPALIALVGPPPDYSNNPNQVVQKPSSFVNSVTVYIRITSAPPGGGSVHVFTQDGNARSEEPYHEYDAVNEIKTFSAGDSYIPIQMRVYATPNFASGNGTFTLNLDTEVHGIITKAQALITILDTNPPSVNLSVADTQVVETQPAAQVPGGNANAEFTVTLSGPSDRLVTINAATTDGTAKAGTDYTATQVSLAFLPGETRKVVMVPVLDTPGRNEPEETFSLILSTPVNANVSKGAAICTIHQPVTPGPAVNISTRLRVLTGENVLIGGFIVTGTKPKTVLIRGLGPSLPLADKLLDPTLQLFDGAGKLLASNDDWQSNQAAAIRATTIPPTDPKESAIIATLAPNAGYTAILAGKNAGKGGGLVEIYDLSLSSDSALANISTRGFVDAGDNVMIGGFIVGVNSESAPTRMIIRGIGPSLPVKGKLQDPFLELHDANGATIATNDNWKDTQQKEIEFTGIPPSNNLESAIVKTLTRGKYTAVLRGKGGGVGVGLVEAYKLN
jgi:hypothetical protein